MFLTKNQTGAAMFKKSSFLCFAFILFFLGCASTSPVKRTEPVTIILKNGDKIEAEVLDIWHDKIVFKAKNWKQAYEYGEVLNVERIDGIRIADGSTLSVDDYDAYRKGGKLKKSRKRDSDKTEAIVETEEMHSEESGDYQYEELKKKPISEMTENEFKYFIMMKEKELNAQKETESAEEEVTDDEPVKEEVEDTIAFSKAGEKTEEESEMKQEEVIEKSGVQDQGLGMRLPRPSFSPLSSSFSPQLEEAVESIIEAGLAPSYLSYLGKKSKSGEELSSTETTLLKMIENNPKWQEKLEDLKYLSRVSQKALSRAYLYNPDELSTKLGLMFDPDMDMDYLDLMEQLHRKFGEDVNMGEFRILVDVLGESGGRATRDVLVSYDAWRFVLSKDKSLVTK
ncbi:MAG: hypothetical protein ACE5NG_05435 [bacterium]